MPPDHPLSAANVVALSAIPPGLQAALGGSVQDFIGDLGPHLLSKADAFHAWSANRQSHGLRPYVRYLEAPPGPHTALRQEDGSVAAGLNFASQDYLALASHPQVLAAAQEAMTRYGVHSAGSAVLAGNVGDTLALEQELADFLGMPEALLFPTGWAAGYGVLRALVRPSDHVVLDQLAHNCLQEGARAATPHVHLHRHLDLDHLRKLLTRLRQRDQAHGILVVTEGVFSMDADSPDLPRLQALVREFNALLLVDVAHDLGATGPGGQGQIGVQGLHGKLDLVMGAFSKSFASNGGFVACRSAAVKDYLRFFAPSCAFSNALSPLQIAVVRQCLRLVQGEEGQHRRDQLLLAVTALREGLQHAGLQVLGHPGPIVPVLLGEVATARLAVRDMNQRGLLANLVEFPAVARHGTRLRLQVMSAHMPAQAAQAATLVAEAVARAERHGVELRAPSRAS